MSKVLKGTSTNGLHYKDIRKPAVTYWSALVRATVTFDPPSLATVTGAVSSDITVEGAAVGDRVELFPPYSTQGVMCSGFVDNADTVKISLFNPTGATIDLGSGDWVVLVVKP